jgi:PIN domain nuclease of toxin-antitoxin system
VRLLIDTQCWLWLNAAPERLSPTTLSLLESDDTDLLLSAVSAWEIAVKHATGKVRLPMSPRDFVETRLQSLRTNSLPLTHAHALRAAELPRHHRDPFDRLLVAQAQIEGLRLVTGDPKLRRYDVELVVA